MKLFIDTWGWITLSNRREARHGETTAFYRDFRNKKGESYTSDYVLDETLTLLFRHMPFNLARQALSDIEEAMEKGYLKLEWISPERFRRAKELRLRFEDKPWISFTDLTSMVVTEELGIKEVLTEDEHFVQVGMGLYKVP